tara:strand:- start:92106 stop:92972 length:867 start_codon:yes stop_codon:yes gene_type:complete
MGIFDKHKNAIAGAVMAIGGLAGFSGNAKANENTQSLETPTVATTQADSFSSYKADHMSEFEQFKMERAQSEKAPSVSVNSNFEEGDAFNELDNDIEAMHKAGASNMHVQQTTLDGVTETTIAHNGEGDIELDTSVEQQYDYNGQPIDVEMSAEDLAAEAERHRIQGQFHDMNDKIQEHGVSAHSINTDLREALAAQQCGIELSDGNLFTTLSSEEVVNLHTHMQQLNGAHTLDAEVLIKLAGAQCDKGLSPELTEEIQTKLEISQGDRFAEEYGLDKDEVNAEYIDR